ncbi:MAG: endonuclease MutS2 [Armatimonadota bacterium]
MSETQPADADSHALRVLEYGRVAELLAERTACALGRERALELTPTPVFAFVQERQRETTEARKVVDVAGLFPFGGVHDVRRSLADAEIRRNLLPHALLDLASTLAGAGRLKSFVLRHAEIAPLLADRARAIEEFPGVLAEIELCIGRGGDVLDSASPALGAVRDKIRLTARGIEEKLNTILSSSATRGMLMGTQVVLRDDRRCLPVKAEFKRSFPGIVHDQSSTGATLFIEPMPVVQLNNALRQLESQERREIDKVLERLTNAVHRIGARASATVDVVAYFDLLCAKARLAIDMGAVEPKVNREGEIRLDEARHPLLDPETVVPVSVRLGSRTRALLITGPNTGGKTVTLKTVGLLTLMAQAGLHVPARSGSELAHFDQVFADIGDEQSIAQSLSTFSGHIVNIVGILRRCGRRALVLLDELGAGTDPAEGAALAKSILADLLDHNARIVATTHYGELKEFAFSRDGIENASVEFDIETLRPTYRLLQGVPGASNAFHIARRLGMPARVVDAAEGSRSEAAGDSAEVMVRLEKAKRDADEERRKAEAYRRDLENLRRKYEQRLQDLELLRSQAKERAAEEARLVIRQKTEKMDNIISELRRMGKEGRKTQSARKQMREAAVEMVGGIGFERAPEPVDPADVPESLRKGETVRVTSLGGAEGVVLADAEDGDVLVQVGMMRVTVPIAGLRRPGGGGAAVS